jgi:endonuclease G
VSQSGQQLSDFGWLTLNPTPGKAFIGEYLTIIQHPRGERKQVCVRENKLLKYAENEPWVWYQTDTVGGSSGSPVFNTSWDVVALHHQSVPRSIVRGGQTMLLAKNGRLWTPDMGDDAIDWIANEGVRVSSIVAFLKEQHSSHPLAAAILRNERAPLREVSQTAASGLTTHQAAGGITVSHQPDGRTTIRVPVEIDLRINTERWLGEQLDANAAPLPIPPSVSDSDTDDDSAPPLDFSREAKIDRSNYSLRNGYQPEFIGGGLRVPLPKISGNRFGRPLKLKDGSIEIKYWNYSVVMNPQRRLAFFAAANIRPAAGLGTDDGTDFISDDRVTEVAPTAQLNDDFYGKQKTFESDTRLLNPFDKGHLTRREDLQWGRNLEEAIRNGDDSFHFTNCAPQHFAFNQRSKKNGLWYRLEVLATKHLTAAPDLCIINGPVFDAPESDIRDGKLRQLRLNGKRHSDRKFGGVQIPKMFFKLVAWQQDRKLFARAFVVSQETLLHEVSRMHESEAAPLTPAEIALYEIRITDLEKLTGLRFGIPASAQPRPKEATLSLDQPRRVSGEDDV